MKKNSNAAARLAACKNATKAAMPTANPFLAAYPISANGTENRHSPAAAMDKARAA